MVVVEGGCQDLAETPSQLHGTHPLIECLEPKHSHQMTPEWSRQNQGVGSSESGHYHEADGDGVVNSLLHQLSIVCRFDNCVFAHTY